MVGGKVLLFFECGNGSVYGVEYVKDFAGSCDFKDELGFCL